MQAARNGKVRSQRDTLAQDSRILVTYAASHQVSAVPQIFPLNEPIPDYKRITVHSAVSGCRRSIQKPVRKIEILVIQSFSPAGSFLHHDLKLIKMTFIYAARRTSVPAAY